MRVWGVSLGPNKLYNFSDRASISFDFHRFNFAYKTGSLLEGVGAASRCGSSSGSSLMMQH
jgi:hypothetical protein